MKCLVIGGSGLLGCGIVDFLSKTNIDIVCFSYDEFPALPKHRNVKFVVGNVWDTELLKKSLENVDCVIDCISTTMPSTNSVSLDDEIEKTLKYYNYILSTIKDCNVKHYLFPSSGGAIYGNTTKEKSKESDELMAYTPYGVGKKMAEDILKFYCMKYDIAVTILRIGNLYGSRQNREKMQGAIDLIIQNGLDGKPFFLWNNAEESIRDYVFLEDVANAFYLCLLKYHDGGFRVFNVGTGIGTSLKNVIDVVEKELSKKIEIVYKQDSYQGVNKVVLDVEKIKECVGWEPKTTITEGIKKTILLKEHIR